MGVEETKHDLMLRRVQVTIAILVGMVTLAVGLYNVKHTILGKKGAGNVSVHVRTDNGQPAPQATIEISRAQGGVVANAETGSDGTYAKKGLALGNYTVKAGKGGFQSDMLVFAIEPSETAELNLTLKASASSPIQSAVEEVGASWIKNLGMPRNKSDGKSDSNP